MPDVKEKTGAEVDIDTVTEHTNALTFDEKVIKKIAGYAVAEIPGIFAISGSFMTGLTDILRSADDPTKGISVEVGKQHVAVSLKVICEYGRNIPEIFQNIVDKVGNVMKEMTGLDVVEVNVHVNDVLTKDDFDRQSKRKADDKAEIARTAE